MTMLSYSSKAPHLPEYRGVMAAPPQAQLRNANSTATYITQVCSLLLRRMTASLVLSTWHVALLFVCELNAQHAGG